MSARVYVAARSDGTDLPTGTLALRAGEVIRPPRERPMHGHEDALTVLQIADREDRDGAYVPWRFFACETLETFWDDLPCEGPPIAEAIAEARVLCEVSLAELVGVDPKVRAAEVVEEIAQRWRGDSPPAAISLADARSLVAAACEQMGRALLLGAVLPPVREVALTRDLAEAQSIIHEGRRDPAQNRFLQQGIMRELLALSGDLDHLTRAAAGALDAARDAIHDLAERIEDGTPPPLQDVFEGLLSPSRIVRAHLEWRLCATLRNDEGPFAPLAALVEAGLGPVALLGNVMVLSTVDLRARDTMSG